MPTHWSANLLMIDLPWLIYIIYVFITILSMQILVIMIIGLYKKNAQRNKLAWKQIINDQITAAIFYEGPEEGFEAVDTIPSSLIKNRKFRQVFIDEIIHAKKSFSGTIIHNLVLLYQQFGLQTDSYKKLKGRKWQTKARGINELALLRQTKYVQKLFRLSNNNNELVRTEAQCGLVCLYGFPGLRFLNVVRYPVSEWQQIQLLNKLKDVQTLNLESVKKWLQSSNESVVIFALKLAAFYKNYLLYNSVLNCLNHSSAKIKLLVLDYLKNMPEAGTCQHVISNYFTAHKDCKLAMLRLIQEIGSQTELPFLFSLLKDKDEDIREVSAIAISALHPMGKACLQSKQFDKLNGEGTTYVQIIKEQVA